MIKKLKTWFVKSLWRIEISLRWWVWWSNLYQKFELKFLGLNETHHIANISMGDWEHYTRNLWHYGGDKWYQLWDVISHPLRTLYRGGNDCDDFALLGLDYFGKRVVKDGVDYISIGIKSLIYEDGSGHVIAMWRGVDTDMNVDRYLSDNYFIVSNKETFVTYMEEGIYSSKSWKGVWAGEPKEIVAIGTIERDENNELVFIDVEEVV